MSDYFFCQIQPYIVSHLSHQRSIARGTTNPEIELLNLMTTWHLHKLQIDMVPLDTRKYLKRFLILLLTLFDSGVVQIGLRTISSQTGLILILSIASLTICHSDDCSPHCCPAREFPPSCESTSRGWGGSQCEG